MRNANVKGRRGNVTPTFNPPPSPVKSEPGGTKRKGRENETPEAKNWKRSRASSRGTPTNGSNSPGPEQPASPQLIECPEPNCNKKYKHINGLKYHQSHAHNNAANDDETTSTEGRAESEVEESQPSSPAPVVETPVDKSAQDVVKPSVLRYTGPPATSPSPGPSEDASKGTNTMPASQPSVIQTRVPPPSPAVYVYNGSGSVVSPQHPPLGSPGVGVANSGVGTSPSVVGVSPSGVGVSPSGVGVTPVSGSIPQVRPGSLVRPEVRPEMMVRGSTGPRPTISPVVAQVPPATTNLTILPPQGTPLSSLPGNSPGLITVKQSLLESDKNKPKELINGLVNKDVREEDHQPGREDARSPAYSDISDANDTAPVMDGDNDNKDLQDDNKKSELPLGAQPYPPYGMYYPYGQPPPPFLMPPIQPPPGPPVPTSKDGDGKDLKDKPGESDKRDSLPPPGSSEFLSKIPTQYLYPSPYYINAGYPDHFLREAPIYKEVEGKDLVAVREGDKGPTDLSKTGPGGLAPLVTPTIPKDKLGMMKDKQVENHTILKEAHEIKGHLDKRPFDEPPLAYRYPFDQRLPLPVLPQDKIGDKGLGGGPKHSPPAPMSSPRVVSTPPANSALGKDDRGEKKVESKNEGVKPTMETTGPPPPPTSTAYYPSFPYSPLPYDPYRTPMVPSMTLPPGYPPPHYLAPPSMVPRFPLSSPVSNAPEDLSRGGSSGSMIHPQLYSNHKIHELQERARKSPLSAGALGMTPPGLLSTPHKIGSPMNSGKEGSPLGPIVTSASVSIPSSSSSLTHGERGPMGGGMEGRSPPTSRPPPHHLHEGFSPYSLLPPQYHYAGKLQTRL